MTNLAQRFDETAARLADRAAVVEAERAWSYAQLRQASEAIGRQLERDGCGPGVRVALVLPNAAAFCAAFFAVARIGAVVAPMNPRYGTQDLEYYLARSEAAALLVPPSLVETAAAVIRQLPAAPSLFAVDESCRARALAERQDDAVVLHCATEDPLLQQYTSGSTGAPKGVVRGHRQLTFELESLGTALKVTEADRFLGVAPFSHVNGLVRSMMLSLFSGAALFPRAAFDRRGILQLLTEKRLTVFGGVPQMFVALAGTPLREPVDLSALRIAFSASAPLLPEDNLRFHDKFGLVIRQLYGSTETGTISVNLDDDPRALLASVGRALPGVEVRILNEDHGPVPAGEEGEVAIASPAGIRAYADGDADRGAAFFDGFYLSGDLGFMAPDGAITLTGRKKFLINRGGYKVNPQEVERAIASFSKVDQVVVYGKKGRHGDDSVACVVVPKESCTEIEILEHCRGKIADFKIPSFIAFRESLPLSETGKVLRHKL